MTAPFPLIHPDRLAAGLTIHLLSRQRLSPRAMRWLAFRTLVMVLGAKVVADLLTGPSGFLMNEPLLIWLGLGP